MPLRPRLKLSCMIACLALSACANTPPSAVKDTPPPPKTLVSKVGTVALVQAQRHREVNNDNWQTAIAGMWRNQEGDEDANVVRKRYEVTVFYAAGEQETILLDEDPKLRSGQRVRVTGDKVEPLSR